MEHILSAPYDALYEEYLDYKKTRVSAQGFESARTMAYRIIKWFELEELLPWEISVADAVRFKKEAGERIRKDGKPVSAGTVQNYMKAVRSFYRYLIQTEKVKSNPFEEVKNPRLPKHISRNVLTEPQMNRLLEKLASFSEIEDTDRRLRRYRCHVLSEFLYATGLRIAEAGSLVDANIDLANRKVFVPEGKGGKSRTAFLTGYACDVLEEYMKNGRKAVFGNYWRPEAEKLFGASKSRLAAVLNEELFEVCSELEIPVITSHGFRHSLGTHLLQNGCDMRYIQVILGHESIGTTQVYTNVYKEDLRNSIDEFHPRNYRRKEI